MPDKRRLNLRRIFTRAGQWCLGLALALGLGLLTGLDGHGLSFRAKYPAIATPTVSPRANSRTVGSDASILLEQGQQRYKAGRFAEAATIWQQAATAFASQAEVLGQARALSYLSLAYQKLGKLSEAEAAITNSLENLRALAGSDRRLNQQVLAQALNTQGSLQLATGQTTQALETWQQAAAIYTQVGDQTGKIGSLINQARAQQVLGFYLQARKTLATVEQILIQSELDPQVRAIGLYNLGEVLRAIGDLDMAQQSLMQSLELTRQQQLTEEDAILLSLGNTALAQQQPDTALKYYQQVVDQAQPGLIKTQAQLNLLNLAINQQQWPTAQLLQAQIRPQIASLPLSRNAIYAQIHYIQSLGHLHRHRGTNALSWAEIARLAADTVQAARQLQDIRAEAYALGNLAAIYEQAQQWPEAIALTRRALTLAQQVNASEITYQWQWQLGRLLASQAKQPGTGEEATYQQAIAAYSNAVETLQTIRGDLVAISSDVQFSFRDSVEPVYRQFAGLLLPANPQADNQEYLRRAREVIEALQLAQLENFFQEACLNAQPVSIDQVDQRSAVLYSILLSDRFEIILALPNQPLKRYSTAISQADVEALVDQMRANLRRTSSNEDRLQVSQQIYNLVLGPAEAAIAESGIKTLVFVLDGVFQSIPIAALYDGQHYLIDKFNIALAPSLQLLDPQPLQPKQLKVLMAGLSEASQGFAALPGVELEVQQVKSQLPVRVLLNQQFTSEVLQEQIETVAYPVVHLATHGQFSSDAKDTFILAWDRPINVKQLDTLLRARGQGDRRPIELLVLSACQTAAGDKRAALGLAGVAVRSGARSTLATLWSVDDQSTSQLMVQFYQAISQGTATKAEALRQAQLSLKQEPGFGHPYYWAPFVLIGNWL